MRFALFLLLAISASAEVAPLLKAKEKIDGSYIIKLKDSFDASLLADSPALSALGGQIQQRYQKVLNGFSATLTEDALSFIRNSGLVEYVEENGIARKAYSWGCDRVNQDNTNLDLNVDFTIGNGGEGASVFVIDTGVSPDDPEFEGRVTAEVDCVSTGRDTGGKDCDGHGTHCSGTVGSVSYGIARKTSIYGVRVLNCQGWGSWDDIIAGCEYVANSPLPLKVASLSIGGGLSTAVNDAIQHMIDSDVAVAVAAGNENDDACGYSPASAPNALTVGATDQNDTRASFSNFGICVDIFAPGVSITSTVLEKATASWSGTSMATPHVAGVMALARVDYPNYNGQDIINLVKSNAKVGLVTDANGSDNNLLYCP